MERDVHATRSRAAHSYDPRELAAETLALSRALLGGGSPVLEKIDSGVSSLNYLVTHEAGRYILRLELFRDIAEVRADLQLAADAARWGVATQPGALHVGHLCGLPVVVRPFIPGRILDPADPADAGFVGLAGRQLGLLHGCPAGSDRPWFYADAIGDPAAIRAGDGDLQDHARALVAGNAGLLAAAEPSRSGLIHTDFKSDNLIRSADQIYVIDWEKATTGPQLFDLGLALFHLIALADRATAWRRARAFLSGYRAARPLSDQELAALPGLIGYAAGIFFLIDAEIHEQHDARARGPDSDVGARHAAYYAGYCAPAFGRLLARQEELHAMQWLT